MCRVARAYIKHSAVSQELYKEFLIYKIAQENRTIQLSSNLNFRWKDCPIVMLMLGIDEVTSRCDRGSRVL